MADGFDANQAFSMAEKVVIVTGGGTGIGKVYSQRLAEAGAKVVLADIAADESTRSRRRFAPPAVRRCRYRPM